MLLGPYGGVPGTHCLFLKHEQLEQYEMHFPGRIYIKKLHLRFSSETMMNALVPCTFDAMMLSQM